MIVIFGKGKVGNGLKNFLTTIQTKFIMMDDEDYNEEILSKAKRIIASPGIPPHHKLYKSFGNKVVSELNFLGEWLDKNGLRDTLIIIGISGTNGKSTTTHITYKLLEQIFKKEKNTDIYLSGNFGTPLSETLSEVITKKNNTHIIVTECSSFMLYKLQNFYFDYSILTNIETDHLDRHPDKADYTQAKINLIKHTKQQAFTTQKVYDKLDKKLQNKTEIFGYDYDLSGTQFVGHHNQANLQSVFLLTQKLLTNQNINISINIDTNEIQEKIKNIKPLEHRMQLYTTINGVDIYDDAICTSAHAQENALKGLNKKIVLICGGYDKGDDFDYLGKLYKDKVSYGVFIGLTAIKFEKIFTEQKISFVTQKTLHNAIQTAFEYAKNNKLDLVFSPACASFDMFKNVYDRIEQFEEEIKQLDKIT